MADRPAGQLLGRAIGQDHVSRAANHQQGRGDAVDQGLKVVDLLLPRDAFGLQPGAGGAYGFGEVGELGARPARPVLAVGGQVLHEAAKFAVRRQQHANQIGADQQGGRPEDQGRGVQAPMDERLDQPETEQADQGRATGQAHGQPAGAPEGGWPGGRGFRGHACRSGDRAPRG